ncbi:MAG: hypothetical protein GX220_08390 [Treponema sp.]|jgi:ankyrin repeat protein|nr:hypothetical protein [Treponema sp.]
MKFVFFIKSVVFVVVFVMLGGAAFVIADVNEKDMLGMTALMRVVRDNVGTQKVEALIKAGADVNARDRENKTALMWASWKNTNPSVIKMLLKYEADPKAINVYGKKAIDFARENEKIKNTDAYRQLNDVSY